MVMVILLISLIIGAGIGYCLRNRTGLFKHVSILTEITVGALLVLLGASIGMNDLLLKNLGGLGLDAALLAGGAVLGSILAVIPVYLFFFKGKV